MTSIRLLSLFFIKTSIGHMDYSKSSLEDLYARLSIEDEESGGVILGKEVVGQHKESFVLIGRFITEKNINFPAMQTVLSSLWRPKEGVEIQDIGGGGIHLYSIIQWI